MPDPKNSPRIFLSYTRKDGANVKALYQRLKSAGYHPWMDIEDILAGQDWEQVLIQAINDATFFLACLSTNSIDHRGVVQEEIKQALQVWRRKLDDDIYFIPIRLDDCQVPEALAKFNWGGARVQSFAGCASHPNGAAGICAEDCAPVAARGRSSRSKRCNHAAGKRFL